MSGRTADRFVKAGVSVGAVATLIVLSAFNQPTVDSGRGLASDPLTELGSLGPEIASVEFAWNGGLHASRPLEHVDLVGREAVEDWIEHFQVRDRRTFETVLGRLGSYESMITERLIMRDLPVALMYVPVIESALSATAKSSADAVGLWQLREGTARELGLRVDEWVDERRDPVRATEAALDYLEQLHARFGSWELALIAYNSGPARVASRIRWYARGADDPNARYEAIIQRLPRETRDYLPKLLATRILAESSQARFAVDRAVAYDFDEVMVPPRTSLIRVAEAHGSTLRELRALNPHLLRWSTPPSVAYPVRVPLGTSAEVVAVLRGVALPPGDPTA